MNYFDTIPQSAQMDTIVSEHKRLQKWINQDKKGFLRYRNPAKILSEFKADYVNCGVDAVTIGDDKQLSREENAIIREHLKSFMPWRKGPFSVFGNHVDSEWRSERKWNRVVPVLPDLKGKIIADIGCNNGYYMFRMADADPKMVLGFEPSIQHYYCFNALNGMAGLKNLHIDLLGIEHLHLFENTFDMVFLMGIIYHRPSPIDTLRDILSSLTPGGSLILESQAIPGDEPYALFPDNTYAKVPGTYFVPTGQCVYNWMKKAGFTNIDFFCSHPMSDEEQRQTEWMTFESYNDFIQTENQSLTIEGYPAPCRIYLKGDKKE
ncbi:tRNA 5-methoxyuridine(34)/uridine 5-oxyacetic acid(34) synthase CmoB [Desulforhopalus sp. 52FAK]